MNILYLTNHLNIGGVTSYVLSLARGMKQRGHEVYVASSGGQLLPAFLSQGIGYIPIPIRTKQEVSPSVFLSFWKLRYFIKEKDIQLMHANTRVTQVLAGLLHKFCGKTYVSTCHGFFKNRLSRRLFPCWGRKVIAISEAVRDHLMRDFKIKEEDIRVIHNGIDTDKFQIPNPKSQSQKKQELGLRDGPVIGIIGRLSDVKGHIYLIEAMKLVLEKIPQAQLLVVGEGRMKKELLALVKRLGIEKNVYFLASVADTAQVLAAMDLFVMPSLKEGLGLSLMEAEACGLAVIGSDVGGIRSLIKDGYNGLLVRPADSMALTGAILNILQDKNKAVFLGQNARDFIRQNFSAERMVSETEKLYLDYHAG
jgi:glycosyltransferase involved in cell wall biosynthesis